MFNSIKLIQSHVSKDRSRRHLSGVFFKDGKAVATDGHRLVEINLDSTPDLAAIAKENADAIYSFKEHAKIEAKYPNYKQLIPEFSEKTHKKLSYNFPYWFAGIKLKRHYSAIFLTKDGFQLFKPEIPEREDGSRPDGEPSFVALNPAYLAPFADLKCEIYFKDSMSPVVIKHEIFTAVIMPMRA